MIIPTICWYTPCSQVGARGVLVDGEWRWYCAMHEADAESLWHFLHRPDWEWLLKQ